MKFIIKNYFFCIMILLSISLISCKDDSKTSKNQTKKLKIMVSQGVEIPFDSLERPTIIPIDISKINKFDLPKPIIKQAHTNYQICGNPSVFAKGNPKVKYFGKDSRSSLITKKAKFTKVKCGIPEVIHAKEMVFKDKNFASFGTLSKQQGLKSDIVFCQIQDQFGNLWFGTDEGVTKFDGKYFTNYTTRNGLPGNSVTCIIEDKKGNIWLGGSGITKFDGKYFTIFKEDDGKFSAPFKMIEDKFGNIWFAFFGEGVTKFDGENQTYYTEENGIPGNYVTCLAEDKDGNIWIGTANNGIGKIDSNSVSVFNVEEGLSDNDIRSILCDSKGKIWLGTNFNGINIIDGDSIYCYTKNQGLAGNCVRSIYEDNLGNIWISGGWEGFSYYDGKGFTNYNQKDGLPYSNTSGFLQDKLGNIWICSSYAGVTKLSNNLFNHYTVEEGLFDNSLNSIYVDKNDILWLAPFKGGIVKYDGVNFISILSDKLSKQFLVADILEDRNSNMWFACFQGVLKFNGRFFEWFTDKNGLCHNDVRCIFEDNTGNIWFGTFNGLSKYDGSTFTNYSTSHGLIGNMVFDIEEDDNGCIWIANNNDGVVKINNQAKVITQFSSKDSIFESGCRIITKDLDGNLWFGGGFRNGIVKYDFNNFIKITEDEGLCNNRVSTILSDTYGNLWFGTEFGLSKLTRQKSNHLSERIRLKTLTKNDIFFYNYNYEDGFLGTLCREKSLCESKDGKIWIGTQIILTSLNKKNEVPDSIAPLVQLKSLGLFNQSINWSDLEYNQDSSFILDNGINVNNYRFNKSNQWNNFPENLNLAYNNNYLNFNFIGITQHRSNKIKYQFKLEGYDEDWSGITHKDEAAYGNLSSGDYTFIVKAMNSEGIWSREYKYQFTISPPWWFTWWAYLLYSVSTIGIVFMIVLWNGRKLRERSKMLEIEIEKATKLIIKQKEEVEEKNEQIYSSIRYASTIQTAILPWESTLKISIDDYFILYKPKDIVSGDSYWFKEVNGIKYFAVIDCTGHGIPGAMLTIIASTVLDEAVLGRKISDTSEILTYMNEKVTEILNQKLKENNVRDGMEVGLIAIQNEKIQFSGAGRPLYLKNGKMDIIKTDKRGIAGQNNNDIYNYSSVEIERTDNLILYLSSDGYADQMNENSKKYSTKRFLETLEKISGFPLEKQKEILENEFNSHKGSREQIDDVTLIGVMI